MEEEDEDDVSDEEDVSRININQTACGQLTQTSSRFTPAAPEELLPITNTNHLRHNLHNQYLAERTPSRKTSFHNHNQKKNVQTSTRQSKVNVHWIYN